MPQQHNMQSKRRMSIQEMKKITITYHIECTCGFIPLYKNVIKLSIPMVSEQEDCMQFMKDLYVENVSLLSRRHDHVRMLLKY